MGILTGGLGAAGGGGGGGTSTWTAAEKAQIRYRLGIDGASTPASVNTPKVVGPDPTDFTPVDHDSGGAAALSYTIAGVGVLTGRVRAFTTADWAAGRHADQDVAGTTTTRADGSWVVPMMLPPGDYTLLYSKDGVPGFLTRRYVVT